MDSRLDEFIKILEDGRKELHTPGMTEEEMQHIVDVADEYLVACTRDTEQARATIAFTRKQQQTIASAHESVKQKAEVAAAEEADARTAADAVRKMLDDAFTSNGAANGDVASILQKAADALQDTINAAESSYQEKAAQRQIADNAVLRVLATERSVEHAMAKAYTAEGQRIKDQLIAEKLLEVKIAEKDTLSWVRKVEELQSRRLAGGYEQKLQVMHSALEQAQNSLEENNHIQIMEEEQLAQKIATAKEEAQRQILELENKKEDKQQKRDSSNNDLLLAQADAANRSEASDIAVAEAEGLAGQLEEDYARHQVEKEEKYANWEAGIEAIRNDVENKRHRYSQAGEEWSTAVARLEDSRRQEQQMKQRVEAIIAEEDSARSAAQVARRLADNAVKVRLSVSTESADLLSQAQNVLTESADAAEVLARQKSADRFEIEKTLKEVEFKVTQGEAALIDAQQAVNDAKNELDLREEALRQEIDNVEQEKVRYNDAFAQQQKEDQERLELARNKAEQAQTETNRAMEKVDRCQAAVIQLDNEINEYNNQIDTINRDTDAACAAYTADTESRLEIVRDTLQEASQEIEKQMHQIDATNAAVASLDEEEAQLRTVLSQKENTVNEIIRAAASQIYSADENVQLLLLTEEETLAAVNAVNADLVDMSIVEQAWIAQEEAEREEDIEEASLFDNAPAAPIDVVDDADEADNAQDMEVATTDADHISIEETIAAALDDIQEGETASAETIETQEDIAVSPMDLAAEAVAVATENDHLELDAEIEENEEAISEATAQATAEVAGVTEEPIAEVSIDEQSETAVVTDAPQETAAGAIQEIAVAEEPEEAAFTADLPDVADNADSMEYTAGDAAEDIVDEIVGEIEEKPAEEDFEDKEAARIRAQEEAEEAEILKGLTGSIPKVDPEENASQEAEYTAWLNIIDDNVVQKIMAHDMANRSAADDVLIDNLMAAINDEVQQPAAENQAIQPAEEPKQNNNAKEGKKKKRPFRFF